MDEFGSRIAHSDTPTVAMVPFFHILTQMSYSVIWPLCNLQYGGQLLAKSKTKLFLSSLSSSFSQSASDDLTRNRVPSTAQPGLDRVCHALPWSPPSTLALSDSRWSQLADLPVREHMPATCQEELPDDPPGPPSLPSFLLKVFTDIDLVQRHLKHPRFELVSSEEDADILWMYSHFKNFK